MAGRRCWLARVFAGRPTPTSTPAAPPRPSKSTTGAITYLDTDSLGSVRGIISSAGALTATTSYDAWGNPQTTGGLTSYTPFGHGLAPAAALTAHVHTALTAGTVLLGACLLAVLSLILPAHLRNRRPRQPPLHREPCAAPEAASAMTSA